MGAHSDLVSFDQKQYPDIESVKQAWFNYCDSHVCEANAGYDHSSIGGFDTKHVHRVFDSEKEANEFILSNTEKWGPAIVVQFKKELEEEATGEVKEKLKKEANEKWEAIIRKKKQVEAELKQQSLNLLVSNIYHAAKKEKKNDKKNFLNQVKQSSVEGLSVNRALKNEISFSLKYDTLSHPQLKALETEYRDLCDQETKAFDNIWNCRYISTGRYEIRWLVGAMVPC